MEEDIQDQNKNLDIKKEQKAKNDKTKIRSAISKTIIWGLGIIFAIGISAVGSLSVLGILTLSAIFTSAALMEILPWFLVGLGTTISLTCRKGFVKNFLHTLINHDGGFREWHRSDEYKKRLLYSVWFFICAVSILSSGFVSLLSNLVSLWVYHRCQLEAPTFVYLLAGSIGFLPSLAIVVFAFHFSPLAFVATSPMLVFTLLATGVHFIRKRYLKPEDPYKDILGASIANLEESKDILEESNLNLGEKTRGSKNDWIKKLFLCVGNSEKNPQSMGKKRDGEDLF